MEWKEKKYADNSSGYTKGGYELYRSGALWRLWQTVGGYKEIFTSMDRMSATEAQAWADQIIRRRELEKRVGTWVREEDCFPAGTEFVFEGKGRRLEWADGKSYMWNIHENAKYIPIKTFYDPDPNSIKISKFTHCEYKRYIITKIGSGVPETPREEEGKMEKETVTLKKEDLLKAHKEGYSATKKALENLCPGVFVDSLSSPKRGNVFLSKNSDNIMIGIEIEGEIKIIYLNNQDELTLRPIKNWLRSMLSGIITLTVKDGKISSAKVNED